MNKLLVLFLLVIAVCYDRKKKKIPNFLFITGILYCLLTALFQKDISQMGRCIFWFFLIVAICWPLFSFRAVGAGDIKLLGTMGVLLEHALFLQTILLFLILSGIGAFGILWKRGLLAERMTYAWQYITDRRQEKGLYYSRERDGTDMTMILTPFLLAAYLTVFAGRWCNIW